MFFESFTSLIACVWINPLVSVRMNVDRYCDIKTAVKIFYGLCLRWWKRLCTSILWAARIFRILSSSPTTIKITVNINSIIKFFLAEYLLNLSIFFWRVFYLLDWPFAKHDNHLYWDMELPTISSFWAYNSIVHPNPTYRLLPPVSMIKVWPMFIIEDVSTKASATLEIFSIHLHYLPKEQLLYGVITCKPVSCYWVFLICLTDNGFENLNIFILADFFEVIKEVLWRHIAAEAQINKSYEKYYFHLVIIITLLFQ